MKLSEGPRNDLLLKTALTGVKFSPHSNPEICDITPCQTVVVAVQTVVVVKMCLSQSGCGTIKLSNIPVFTFGRLQAHDVTLLKNEGRVLRGSVGIVFGNLHFLFLSRGAAV